MSGLSSVPEPASEHVAFGHSWHQERLQGRERKPEEADRQSALRYGIKHNPPARN
jgi:hypothetical protein